MRGRSSKEAMMEYMKPEEYKQMKKAAEGEEAKVTEKSKSKRAQAKEFSEAQVAGGTMADQLMEAYKRDEDMKAMLDEDPKKAEELRDLLAEKAGSGASKMAMAEYATELIEKMYGVPTIVGSIEEEGKKAA